jgi:hypothetical protein
MRAKIKTTDYAGNATVSEGVFAGWGDQVAFERRFGVNAAVMGRLRDAFDESGALKPDADASEIRTEWLAFLAWRVAARGAAAGMDFDTWLESIADLELEIEETEESGGTPAEVPTIATATPLRSS